ncbi:MAG: putative 4-hydroxybenzoate polyprenyltransferase [Bacteroidales bacterium]|nr:putative 4-hydroxybenzoate polyprenyltransferase [Bacteroidales bacterium]
MNIKSYFSLVKFSHTIFALPFAALGFSLAVWYDNYDFQWELLLCVLLCMVFCRSAAMGFNRYADYKFDKKNARTANREIPAGVISPKSALLFVIITSILFIATTWFINRLCFYLSPIALFVVLFYSYTKRFTSLCHIVLGIGQALVPIGAYLAVTGEFAITPIIFSFIVLGWMAGFDILYALQDEDFDRSESLHSIPEHFGREKAMKISTIIHVITALLVIYAGVYAEFSWLYWIAALLFIGCLIFQHAILSPNDISRVNIAFSTTNGIASVIFAILTIASFFIS